MKYIFIYLMFFLISISKLDAQDKRVAIKLEEYKNDTATYIKQFILANKNLYIGKPLEKLLQDLPIVLGYGNGDNPKNKNIFPNITLFFSSSINVLNKLSKKEFPQLIVVTWLSPLNNVEIQSLGLPFWGGDWTLAAFNYYKNKIVGDLEIFK